MALKQIFKQITTPSAVLFESKQFIIKLAENEDEVQQALRLRFEIFNLEQGKGLKEAEQTGIDRDEFDDYCFHLIVIEKKEKRIVGTYRLHPGPVAYEARGFYSEREYNIQGIGKIATETLEVGRSCVAPEFRSGATVAMLWGGIGELMNRIRLRYLLGCVSLETVDPAVGWALYEHYKDNGKVSTVLSATARQKFALKKPTETEINTIRENRSLLLCAVPPLLKGYLRLGTKICGEPVFDDEFGTIDYLILLDTGKLNERYAKHFKYKLVEN